MNLRRLPVVAALALFLVGCARETARTLVVLDASPAPVAADVAARADAFARRGRPVQVLRIGDAAQAVELAARGEGEIALVPEGTALGDFVTSGRGRDVGPMPASAAAPVVRVLEVDGRYHPKVDGAAAGELAAFFAAR